MFVKRLLNRPWSNLELVLFHHRNESFIKLNVRKTEDYFRISTSFFRDICDLGASSEEDDDEEEDESSSTYATTTDDQNIKESSISPVPPIPTQIHHYENPPTVESIIRSKYQSCRISNSVNIEYFF